MQEFLASFDITSSQFIYMLLVVLFGGLVRGYAGFGFSLAVAPLLGVFLAPVVFVPCMFVYNFIGGVQQTIKVKKDADYKIVFFLLIAASLGMPFGTMALKFVSAKIIKLIIGFVVLFAVFGLWKEFKLKGKPNKVITFIAGVFSGFLNTSTSMNGPPVIIYFLATSSNKVGRASLVLFFLFSSIIGLIMSFIGGVADENTLYLAVLTCPGLIIGNALGNWYFDKSKGNGYRKFALVMLLIIGVFSVFENLI